MPTGYTAKLYEGESQTFDEFAMGCARAFGALILMRDDPAGAPIPEFTPHTDYYEKALTRERAELAAAQNWTAEEAQSSADADYDRRLAQWTESDRSKREMRLRYESMLAEVDAWTPPSDDHVEFKKFMQEQLQSSIKFDCGSYPVPEGPNGPAFKASTIDRLLRSIQYDEEHIASEIERTNGRNEWVRSLRDSLGVPVA